MTSEEKLAKLLKPHGLLRLIRPAQTEDEEGETLFESSNVYESDRLCRAAASLLTARNGGRRVILDFKTPGVLDQALGHLEGEERDEVARLLRKFVIWGQSVVVEFDLDAGTARVQQIG